MERTLAIIKPTAVRKKQTGAIVSEIERAGFHIVAITKKQLRYEEAATFYAIHKERPFYQELCSHMSSGSIVALLLEKVNAVEDYRKLIGATNPAEAAPGTLRAQFGISIDDNAVHGSDSSKNAQQEISFFFSK